MGSGQPNGNERIFFRGHNGSDRYQISGVGTSDTNPFNGGSASQRAWSTKTIQVGETLMTPITAPIDTVPPDDFPFGETVKTTVDHAGGGGFDCLSWGAVIFSTRVKDDDQDGLPDGLEDTPGGLKDGNGVALPDLKAMGAGSGKKDIFIEVGAMRNTDASETVRGCCGWRPRSHAHAGSVEDGGRRLCGGTCEQPGPLDWH